MPHTTWRRDCRDALVCFAVSLATVLIGAAWSSSLDPSLQSRGLVDRLFCQDAKAYERIAVDGYSYDPDSRSNVAFFPALPLLARAASAVTGCSARHCLFWVANAVAAAAMLMLARYGALRTTWLHDRKAIDGNSRPPDQSRIALWSFALCPTTFFLHLPYTESLLMLAMCLFLCTAMEHRSLWMLAAIAGMASFSRPTGIVLGLLFLVELARRYRHDRPPLVQVVLLTLVAVSGLGAYMAYLGWRFDAPLAFAQTQTHWRMRPPLPSLEWWVNLAIGEPMWSVYVPSSTAYWHRHGVGPSNPVLNWQAASPVYFVGTALLVAYGWRRRTLTSHEIGLCLGLLLTSYVGRGYEMAFNSQGRFAALAFPIHFVVADGLARLGPRAWFLLIGVGSAIALALRCYYVVLFAADGSVF